MKTNAPHLIAFALAIILASTGCKTERSTVKPGDSWPAPSMSRVPSGGTAILDENPGIVSTQQPIPLPEHWTPPVTNEDRQALAACTIHFAFDSAVIRKNDHSNLQTVSAALQSDPGARLIIEGNCDERGTEEYNRALGERRALAAREALANLGIDPMRIRTISYGKDKPVDPGHNPDAWQKNRRDDFVFLHPQAGQPE